MRLIFLFLLPGLLLAIDHTGSVRAADQMIPGAMVTARQGGAKVVAYTDVAGRYKLDLTPGVWELEVEMFGFRSKTQRLEIPTTGVTSIEWTLEMPRKGDPIATPSASAPKAIPVPEVKKETTPAPTPSETKPATSAAAPTPAPAGRRGVNGRGAQAQAGRGGRGGVLGQREVNGFQGEAPFVRAASIVRLVSFAIGKHRVSRDRKAREIWGNHRCPQMSPVSAYKRRFVIPSAFR
jgi:hypothetical protein